MRQSLRTRLIIICTGMIIFTISMCFIINLFLLPTFYEKSKIIQMDQVYASLNSICKDVDFDNVSDDDSDEIYDAIDKLSNNSGVTVCVMALFPNGGPWFAEYFYPTVTGRQMQVNQKQIERYSENLDKEDVDLGDDCVVLSTEDNFSIYKVYDDRLKSNNVELFGKLTSTASTDYYVYMRSNYQSMQESANVSNQLLLYIGICVTLISIIVMFFISNSYTRPILRLANHAKKMANLDFEARYTECRMDEIGVLGNSMNALSDKLEETISELKTANNELQSDIERKQKQEEMRTEFLANVSHELKTPIALIQGYAEGLQDNINDDVESREFYCEVIIDEANKMNSMVKKLLSLNQLEFGNDQIHFERFDIVDMIRSVVNSMDIKAKQADISLSMAIPDEPVYVWADEYKIDEVVTNYISNAFNHVDNEKRIEIKLISETKEDSEDKLVRISVFNTGKQIPEEDVDRIWDKFYKVDKAHTRAYGGNGIGLSIVKAIMDAHNQKFGVINYDNGVEFWFELDVKN